MAQPTSNTSSSPPGIPRRFAPFIGRLSPLLLAVVLPFPFPAAQEINPPLGAYIHLRDEHFAESVSFADGDRVVLTPYFYWYDSASGAHVINSDGTDALTDHPPSLEGFSYRSIDWHMQELRDMEDAGIQVVLPVYWGEPSQRIPNQPVLSQPWSYAGIPPLVAARRALEEAGRNPPRIGLFYDTSTLEFNAAGQQIDLTTPYGRQWFYETVRDYFSLVPPRHWAMIDGHPIIFLYSASFALKHDQACIDYLKTAFASEFGGREPYVVREISWQVATDQVYAWGGALGLKNPGVASLGPGYDHSAVPGREPLVVDREGGDFFARNWIRFLRRPSPLVMIETWNEYHEGTDIAASREYGRDYIEANRRFVDLFHQGLRPPLPRGPFSDVRQVRVQLQATNLDEGLVQVESADGVTEPALAGNEPCRATVVTPNAGRYLYFRIDDSFKWSESMLVQVHVDYFDSAGGSFRIEYDGSDPQAPFNGAYTSAPERVQLGGTRRWLNARFVLDSARLLNSQNAGADFRIAFDGEVLYIRRVTVERLGIPEEAGATRAGFQQDFADPLGDTWQTPPGAPPLNPPVQGSLVLQAGPETGEKVFNTTPGLPGLPQEILARIRISHPPTPDQRCGGILWGTDPATGQGCSLEFFSPADGPTSLLLDVAATASPFTCTLDWSANRWYWVRLLQQPDAVGAVARVSAKVWLADGDTLEPQDWQAQLDFSSGQSPPVGYPGLLGPRPAARTSLECDYFLAQTAALTSIVVRLPALKPARPTLIPDSRPNATGFELHLWGSPTESYVIQTSSNLADWQSTPVVTDVTGSTSYRDAQAVQRGPRLYRAFLPDWSNALTP